VRAFTADLTSGEQCRALIGEVSRHEPQLDILVNNAGVTWGAPLEEFPDAAWDKVLGVNVKAPFILTRLALPLLRRAARDNDPARVVNIGSIDGMTVPGLNNYSYGAAKAAIHHLTRHLASVLAPSVLVNAIAPGPFPSKMMEKPLEDLGDRIRAVVPVGRIGEPEDVAAVAIFLSSRATNFVTGAVIPLDGGISTAVPVQV
jgi:NAD(P)-dependent dehydrogenase (short-subunit alcohol dehydrogenase family)